MNKPVTTEDIKNAARLILGSGATSSTTTLDVKNHLRSLGYRVHQSEVSTAMDEMYVDGTLTRAHNQGGYYDYSFPTPSVQDTMNRVTVALCDVLEVDAGEVTGGTTMSDLNVDSLDSVAIAMRLETDFNVRLDDNALAKVDTVDDLVRLIDSLLASPADPVVVQPVQPMVPTLPMALPSSDPASWKGTVPVGTWVVREADGSGNHVNPFAFDGSLHRDQARSAYAKLNGVNRDSTRARRVRA